jgi:hypothetical protein
MYVCMYVCMYACCQFYRQIQFISITEQQSYNRSGSIVALLLSWIEVFVCVITENVGWDSSVGIATRYELDGPGIESRWRARFSAPVQTGPGAYPASCTMCTGSFPEVKRPGRDVDHPTPSSAEVKERVELYLYSPSGPSRPVLG